MIYVIHHQSRRAETLNLQQLYYFRTLAEVKHFTKAAMKLMVTQPSLSHSINDLESELGVSLFIRTNRMVTLWISL